MAFPHGLEQIHIGKQPASAQPHGSVVLHLSGDKEQTSLCRKITTGYCVNPRVVFGNSLGIVDEVHTLTSLTGFEALLRGIEVHAYGGPFYAGWGLTNDRIDFPRRKAGLSLEELIAGTLILYPSYYDWQTKGFCTPEDICYRLTQPKGQMRGKFFMRTFAALREKIRNVF